MAYHGHPRYTKDIDIYLAVSFENAEKAVRTLEDFIGSSLGMKPEDFMNPKKWFRMGNPPLLIEFLLEISGVDFETCWANRETAVLEGVEAHFLGLADLRRNKQASGRLQYLADLEKLPPA